MQSREVSYHWVPFLGNDDVFIVDSSVDYLQFMQFLNGQDDSCHSKPNAFLLMQFEIVGVWCVKNVVCELVQVYIPI